MGTGQCTHRAIQVDQCSRQVVETAFSARYARHLDAGLRPTLCIIEAAIAKLLFGNRERSPQPSPELRSGSKPSRNLATSIQRAPVQGS